MKKNVNIKTYSFVCRNENKIKKEENKILSFLNQMENELPQSCSYLWLWQFAQKI